MEPMKIYEFEKMNLKDAVVIDGFPSVGLVSTITANYIINTLGLRQIGIIDSPSFPALSIVRNSEPLSPVRIYAGENTSKENPLGEQIVVFVSEFVPPPHLTKQIATTMLKWFHENKCKLLITPEGLVSSNEMPPVENDEIPDEGQEFNNFDETTEEKPAQGGGQIENGVSVSLDPAETPLDPTGEFKGVNTYAVGSSEAARELLDENEILPLMNGAITGVAGVLLSEAQKTDCDVICLLAEAHKDFPDARAAAKVTEMIDRIVGINVDPEPLYAEAEAIEAQIKMMRTQAMPSVEAPPGERKPASQIMYG